VDLGAVARLVLGARDVHAHLLQRDLQLCDVLLPRHAWRRCCKSAFMPSQSSLQPSVRIINEFVLQCEA